MDITQDELQWIIEHVFLPPRLPQKSDAELVRKEIALLNALVNALDSFLDTLRHMGVAQTTLKTWGCIRTMLRNMTYLHNSESFSQGIIENLLREMSTGDVLPLHIRAQNAGVIFRKRSPHQMTFEAFEASLPTKVILQTKAKVRVSFPANPRLSFPTDSGFHKPLSNVLSYLANTEMSDAVPTTKKGGNIHQEIRDTVSPRYITEALAGVIRAYSSSVGHTPVETEYVHKRIDDHVLWKSALKPWRRSSLWLIVRVALQTTLNENGVIGAEGYKAFMPHFMASILRHAIQGDPDHFTLDVLHHMNAKVARRLSKILALVDNKEYPTVAACVLVIKGFNTILEQRWGKLQEIFSSKTQWESPGPSLFHGCTTIRFVESNEYLKKVITRQSVLREMGSSYNDDETVKRLRSSYQPRSVMSEKKLPMLPKSKELDISLFDIEQWIDTHLSSWKSSSTRSAKDALPVFRLIEWYRMTAAKLYEGNPERLSLMHLCVIELWVALDQLVTSWCPLLTEYSPELPHTLLDPLLLPYLSQMKRLQNVQQYLHRRHEKARLHGNRSTFANTNTHTSFAFRFFDTPLGTQQVALENRMRQSAAKQKQKKLEELRNVNLQYEQLMKEANRLQCTRTPGKKKCKCPKCKLLKSARVLRIFPFEDLLPSSPNLARPIVFELGCPAAFAIWRDATFDILSLARPDDIPPTKAESYPLKTYDAVKDHFKPEYQGEGVTLASSAKSIRHSHYGKGHSLPAKESDVIFQHAGRFQLFHAASRSWVEPIKDATIQPNCTFKLEGIYETLQPYLEGTTHSPNSVLASLIHCPLDLSRREFVVFGQFRSGNRIQWRNLMRAIRSQSISFSDPSVYALVLQTIWQAGPEETIGTWEHEIVYREAHQDLLEVHFTSQVIEELNFAVASLQENWKQLLQLAVIIAIAMRVHCFAPGSSVKESALGLLVTTRALATRWMEATMNFEQASSQENPAAEVEFMRQTAASIAVVLRSTYDFDNNELQNTFRKQDDVVNFLYAGSIISSFSGTWTKGMAFLVERDRRIGLKLHGHVENALRRHPSALACLFSKEIRRPVRGLGGAPLQSPAERWWHMTAHIDDESRKYSIHVDVISGAILIDGKPAQGLPPQITQHPSYKSLFTGYQFFNIRPSRISFEGTFGGSIIRFTLIKDELVIHRQEGEEIEEYIPAGRLADDLPGCLIDGHHHWYSTSRSVIEARPHNCRWKLDGSAYWHITLRWTAVGIQGEMQRKTSDRVQYGVDVHSGLYGHLFRSLQAIEPNKRGLLIITEEADNNTLKPTIFVPRHNLTFSLDRSGQLECQSTPGYVLDKDWSGLSTFFGLQNLLCLRHGSSATLPRKIIVPKGQITAQIGKFGHPLVTIDSSQSSGCFFYGVDTLVGRLVGSRSMESDLYAAKLHAYTSSPFHDPLLQRSGTCEALSRLKSASSYPSNELSPFSRQILEDLVLLTPKRSFYPKQLKVMETVNWDDNLPPTSQNIQFQPLVEEIMTFWRGISLFHQEQDVDPVVDTEVEPNLLNDRITWRDWSIGSDPRQSDGLYCSRDSLDLDHSRKREAKAFRIANAILSPDEGLPEAPSLSQDAYQWAVVRDSRWRWQDVHNWLPSDDDPSPPDAWFGLYSLCQSTGPLPSLDAAVALAFLGYRGMKLNLVSSLIRVTKESLFRQPRFTSPRFDVVDLRNTSQFNHNAISKLLEMAQIGFNNSIYFLSLRDTQRDSAVSLAKAKGNYERALAEQVNRAASEITKTWPSEVSSSVIKYDSLLSSDKFDAFATPALHQWANNHRIRDFVNKVHTSLQSGRILFMSAHLYQPNLPKHTISGRRLTAMTLDGLLLVRSPPFGVLATLDPPLQHLVNEDIHDTLPSPLSHLLGRLAQYGNSPIRSRYLKELQRSSDAYKGRQSLLGVDSNLTLDPQLFETRQMASLSQTSALIEDIQSELLPHSPREELMRLAGLWPDINPHTLLRQLTIKKRDSMRRVWVECLVSYGLGIRDTMRFTRMLDQCLSKKDILLSAEIRWTQNWDASKFPEWILIEIDGNFSIRDLQSDVAYKMLFPDDNRNAVMQLNMGEGKSSVIIPIVASSAANGNALVRVVVPRAQSKQQLHILRRTLTDLCNHRIFVLPFHRKIALDRQGAADVALHLRHGVSSGSIWLCEPEQILSLRLLGIDRITNPKKFDTETGTELVRLQQWLDRTTRDILDESDEVLHARQQVIYTVGDQQDLEGSYLRWEVPQKLLGLFSMYLSTEEVHKGVFWAQWSDEGFAFPHIRCLSEEGRHFIHSFVRHSIRGNNWPIPQHLKESAIDFVTSMSPSSSTKTRIESYNAQEKEEGEPNDRLMHTLMILRGLISCDILLHVLKDKRWRVNYGLDLRRTQLAVPYRAKDYPSQRSEFGHPDITILLTCLSYYYGGLNDDMLEKLIRRLLKSNTPDLTYTEWLRPCWNQVPSDLRTIGGINVEDKVLLKARLFPLLRFNKSTIDFYLNNLVFPRDAKEYPRKLSSSGWDLAREKQLPTTGFSGTNDARFLLPINISQMDNSAHIHTNATVISHLLLDENATVIHHPNSLTSSEILKMTMEHPSNPTVILDVGAQILDGSNLDFVTMWLSLHEDHTKIRAAIYFDERGNLMVLSRDGTIQSFVDSPYSERLDQCLTYLDEAHTRGTDLRLPDACAVVTLGPKLTKDKLVQGCMRMRRLGNGHRLVFFAPEEVAKLIQDGKELSGHPVTTFDVIIWAIQETWRQMHTDISSWAMQGYSFANREEGWRRIGAKSLPPGVVASLFCEPEGHTLASLYANFTQSAAPWTLMGDWHTLHHSQRQLLHRINERCKEFGDFSSHLVMFGEEKEIELVHEKEQEREVQRAPHATALEHHLFQNLVDFVKNPGRLPMRSAILYAQDAFAGTTLSDPPRGFKELFSALYVTRDFCKVIETKHPEAMSRFMRPIEWVITPNKSPPDFVIIISPFEANALMPLFRLTTKLRLHPFAPRNNVTMRSLEDLTWFTVCSAPVTAPLPRQLVVPLNLFSGALFIRDEATYKYICAAMRLYIDPAPLPFGLEDKVTSVGFVWNDAARAELGMTGPGFTMNAVFFFRKLLRFRRHGQGFRPSHMSKVLFGERLVKSDFMGDS